MLTWSAQIHCRTLQSFRSMPKRTLGRHDSANQEAKPQPRKGHTCNSKHPIIANPAAETRAHASCSEYLGSWVVPFCPFCFKVPLLKLNIRKKGYPYYEGAAREPSHCCWLAASGHRGLFLSGGWFGRSHLVLLGSVYNGLGSLTAVVCEPVEVLPSFQTTLLQWYSP